MAGEEKGGEKMIYEWKMRKYPIPAQSAGEEVERIAAVRALTPEAIVEESKKKDSLLHPVFEWDNHRAGHEWRKQQARIMLGNLVTVSIGESKLTEPTRAFVNVYKGEERYTSVDIVVNDAELLDLMLSQALEELNSFRKKYRTLKELEQVFVAIDHAVDLNESVV